MGLVTGVQPTLFLARSEVSMVKTAMAKTVQSVRVQRAMHKVGRYWSSLDVGTHHTYNEKIFCCRVKTVSHLWSVALVLALVLFPLSALCGFGIDTLFFEASVFYTWAMVVWGGLLPWTLLMLRFVLLVRCRKSGAKRAEEIFDFAAYMFLLLMTHVLTCELLGVGMEPFSTSQYLMSSRLYDMVGNEEFLPEDSPNVYKKFEDIGSVDEFWQWLRGPWMSNMMQCANEGGGWGSGDEGIEQKRRECQLTGGHYWRPVTTGTLIRTVRVKSAQCACHRFGPRLCTGKLTDQNMDRAAWTLPHCGGHDTLIS